MRFEQAGEGVVLLVEGEGGRVRDLGVLHELDPVRASSISHVWARERHRAHFFSSSPRR